MKSTELVLALLLTLVLLGSGSSQAQIVSAIDTFRVEDAVASPGEEVPLQFYVANDSSDLAAIAAYFTIDESLLEWVGTWDSTASPPSFYVKYDTLPRAQVPGLFEPYVPLTMVASQTTIGHLRATLIGAGSEATLPPGRGLIIQFYLRVKESAPAGTQTLVRVSDPVDDPPHDDPRQNQYSDASGTINVYPTLITGTLSIGEAICGDANYSGMVDVEDVLRFVNFIFEEGFPIIGAVVGDVNCDEIVNISDAVYIVRYIYAGGPAPCDGCP